MGKHNNAEVEYTDLLHEVFGTEAGHLLLKTLIQRKQHGKMFTPGISSEELAYKAGQYDLIQELKQGLVTEINELDVLKPKKFNPFRS